MLAFHVYLEIVAFLAHHSETPQCMQYVEGETLVLFKMLSHLAKRSGT